MIGAPGNAFFVNMRAKCGVARSSAISVSVIFAGFGASRGVKSKRVVPTRNPAGSAACDASHVRWAVRSGNVRFVLGTREEWQAAAWSEEDFLRCHCERGATARGKSIWIELDCFGAVPSQ